LGMGEGCWAMPCGEARTKATIASAEPPIFQRLGSGFATEHESEVQRSGRRESESDRGVIIPHRIRTMRWF